MEPLVHFTDNRQLQGNAIINGKVYKILERVVISQNPFVWKLLLSPVVTVPMSAKAAKAAGGR